MKGLVKKKYRGKIKYSYRTVHAPRMEICSICVFTWTLEVIGAVKGCISLSVHYIVIY